MAAHLLQAGALAITLGAWGRSARADELPGPLLPDTLAAFAAIHADPPPKQLSADAHFVISDERALWLFHDAVKDRKGAFLGVGTDPGYLFAGWARSDLVLLMDFDQVVVDVHRVYRALFLHAADPAEFLDLWSPGRTAEVEELLQKEYADASPKRAIGAYRMSRALVDLRLHSLKKVYASHHVPTFLDDPAQYAWIVNLLRTGRVVAARGDLTLDGTMQELAEATRKAGIPLRVLYLSNAEAYFQYNSAFRRNVLALPTDGQTMVLRTSGRDAEGSGDGFYWYFVQPGPDFVAWVKQPTTFNVHPICRIRRPVGKTGLYVLGPPPAPPARKAR